MFLLPDLFRNLSDCGSVNACQRRKNGVQSLAFCRLNTKEKQLMMAIGISPLLLLGISAHISVVTAYHYVQSPILGFVAFIFALLDIYLLLARALSSRRRNG